MPHPWRWAHIKTTWKVTMCTFSWRNYCQFFFTENVSMQLDGKHLSNQSLPCYTCTEWVSNFDEPISDAQCWESGIRFLVCRYLGHSHVTVHSNFSCWLFPLLQGSSQTKLYYIPTLFGDSKWLLWSMHSRSWIKRYFSIQTKGDISLIHWTDYAGPYSLKLKQTIRYPQLTCT